MRLPCPNCGSRDIREFTYRGHESFLHRPRGEASGDWSEAWDAHLHLRDNPAGPTRDLWYHDQGCGAWLVVDRNTVTHEITGAREIAQEGRT